MTLLLDDEIAKRKTREECLAEIPEDLRERMTAILQSPELLCWIAAGIERMGVAGEHQLALTLYLTGTSRLLRKPLAVIVQGPSSSGKSYVIERVAKLFPEEAVLQATDMTPQSLYYLPAGELEHRFVVAGERARRQSDETASATKALREMISSGRLFKLTTVSDQDGPRSVPIQQSGPIAYVESTTASELFEEDANRCLVLQPDERPEQTRRILNAEARSLIGDYEGNERECLESEFHALHRLLAPKDVVIPYAEALYDGLPSEPLEIRRAAGHVSSMIQACALLHQWQRETDDRGRIIARPEDFWIARQILEPVLARSLTARPLEALRRFVAQVRKLSGEFTAKEIAAHLKINERTVREHLQSLLGEGAIQQTEPARGPIPAKWLVHAELALRESDSQVLPKVQEVCGMNEESLSLPEMPADWHSADLTSVPF